MNFFKDIVICCSSLNIKDKEMQYKAINHLGGSYSEELTKKVTHLITENPESAKYKIALQRGIPVLTSEWIKECLQYENVNPYIIMSSYLFRPLYNNIINIADTTNDKDRCNYLIKIIEYLGGTYEEHLNTNCTHVVANNPNNKTYDILRKMNVKVITPDWIYNNYLIYANYIDSKNYKEKLRIDSESKDYDFFKNNIFYLSESFPIDTKKMLLKIILKGKGKCAKELTNEVTTFIIKDKILDKDDKKLLLQTSSGTCTIINYSWLLKCYFDKCYIPENIYEITNIFQNSSSVKGSLFKGLTFFIYNFNKVKENSLKEIILLQQGTMYNEETTSELPNELLIVTSFTRKFDRSFLKRFPMKIKLITNYWVEKCILKKKLYDFDKYPMFMPCNLENGITGFQFLVITTTGFSKFEKLYVKQLILEMGSKYTTDFSDNNTILICHNDNHISEKCLKASELNTPIVLVQWLYDCYKKKTFLCYDNYQIKV